VETLDSETIQEVIQLKAKVFGKIFRNKWGMVNQGNILLLKHLLIKHLNIFKKNGKRF